ncbi:FHF complex subunit HOOK interacting protein 2A isoform X2 [Octopus bimaculoides]|uniref:FHF complex subunit HOOK interacting protein 2A isoform X2 n=1 Tax=Octopus bimaculoides TaxID=37653 RepID=UPI0022E21D6C|nr:FHF complex subunit HOOK interacting protein 2A isoform X2 [Octopus bimaculoides]
MKKNMFSKFTNIIQQAVDAIAPNLTLQEEFIHHWKAITNYFIENKASPDLRSMILSHYHAVAHPFRMNSQSPPVAHSERAFVANRDERLPADQTNLPSHLEQMLSILQQEEQTCESGSTGPCMEYMLHHKLLETLYTLGKNDSPPGMKQVVLSFFTRLLTRIKQPLLPHINVHRAVQRLIKICGEIKSGPSENEEIQFLCTLCAKIKSDPYLVNFFLEVPKNSDGPKYAQLSPLSQMGPKSSKRSLEYSIVNSLLAMCSSEDGRVAVKACEGLMLCSSLPEKSAVTCLIENTDFCANLTNRLIKLYQRLPSTVNPDDLDAVYAKWGLDGISETENQQTFPGKRNVVSFLSWLDYCDQLITIANPTVARAFARFIYSNFLVAFIEPAIMQTSESGVVAATAYLRRCLKTVVSSILLSEFVRFILGDEKKPEKSQESSCKMKMRLIERCNHLSEEISLISLKLFDTLLQKNCSFIVYNLVLRNLEGGKHIQSGVSCHYSLQSKCPASLADTVFSDSITIETMSESDDSKSKDLTQTPPSSVEMERLAEAIDVQTLSSDDSSHVSPLHSVSKDGDQNSPQPDDQTVSLQSNSDTEKNHIDSATDNVSVAETSKPQQQQQQQQPQQQAVSEINDSDNLFLSQDNKAPEMTIKYYRSEVHKVINSFLCLLPEDIKSALPEADSGYDMYLRDAHKQFKSYENMCQDWKWPNQMDCSTESDHGFYEGAFLQMLFSKVSQMLHQSYAVNLQVTSVISRLCLFPQPVLHDFFLDPALPVTKDIKLLYSVLQKVVSDIKSRKKSKANFSQMLQTTRKLLINEHKTIDSMRHESVPPIFCMDTETFNEMSAVIVLEEFCKELSAIAFVKQYAVITRLSL